MPDLSLSWPGGPLRGTFRLPASKSESNRALLLQKLAGGGTLTNLSDAHDTVLMQRLLAQADTSDHLDAEDAGTVMRFLTAYLAVTGWRGTLTGTERMRQRPIGPLVLALRQFGARIYYAGQEGFPPLRFEGFYPSTAEYKGVWSREVELPGNISSQFVSALLLVGPTLLGGIMLFLKPPVTSEPYIKMTLALMQHFGAECEDLGDGLYDVTGGTYEAPDLKPVDYAIEADWSAASYAYALVALAPPGSTLELPDLRQNSFQGDQAIADFMLHLGVHTEFDTAESVRLTQVPSEPSGPLEFNFSHCPDLAQTVAVVAAALGRSLTLTGLESLRIKETDRIVALQTELQKFGAPLSEISPGRFQVQAENFRVNGQRVSTYHDHRMAMAFAPLALRGLLQIENPQVVRKSYPTFWDELQKAGFHVLSS